MRKTTTVCLFCTLFLLLTAAANAQKDERLSVTIQEVNDTSIVVRTPGSKVYKLQIDPELSKKVGLRENDKRTIYVSFEDERIMGVQVGDHIVRQRDCSREDCRCENYNCEPACHCRR